MSNLSAFLHPEIIPEKEIKISDRFKENGEVVLFKIRPLSQEEADAITKKCTIHVKDRSGSDKKTLDTTKYMRSLVVAGTVYPDFTDKELCDAYGVVDPLMVPVKMLYTGEFNKLGNAIAELSGINDDEEAIEEAKN